MRSIVLTLERVPIKWNHLIDKGAAQIQRVGACQNRKSRATFSGHVLASVICCLLAAGCDKCGDPVKFNVPSLPNACYDSPRQK